MPEAPLPRVLILQNFSRGGLCLWTPLQGTTFCSPYWEAWLLLSPVSLPRTCQVDCKVFLGKTLGSWVLKASVSWVLVNTISRHVDRVSVNISANTESPQSTSHVIQAHGRPSVATISWHLVGLFAATWPTLTDQLTVGGLCVLIVNRCFAEMAAV